ncbi:uncharacterized protein PV09_02720 [Verruconis gallopava]|uniref:Rhodopsin domain-containing protein n=1 Tax=Verruconis gallopava TaxID=253628 RepID=A0A0D1YZW4_9PEZI|nr:uncharacterized protein PV09_02720 [Verruconis gallopava]KIW06247.1 hypothetical protein PV09_02720 [Verruconis gallopava]
MVSYEDQGAKAKHVVLISIVWSLFGIATLFFCARILIRIKFSKRIFIDDGLAGFALICLLANATLTQIMLPSMYVAVEMEQFSASIKRAATINIIGTIPHFLKYQFAETMIYWTCLWAVKGSFLAFFRRLATNVRGHLIAWWIIVIITALAYIGCVITYPVSCSDFSGIGCTTPRNVRLALVSLRFSTSVDILTDLLIMALPMSLAWRVKLPLKTRLALISVFSLGGLIIFFAIMRVIFTNKEHRQPEISWLNIWSAIEASVACIVCNLAPFKILFKGQVHNHSSDPSYYGRHYAKQEKTNLESHEMQFPAYVEEPARARRADEKEAVEEFNELHPALRPIRVKGDAEFPVVYPQRAKKVNMRTKISANAGGSGRPSLDGGGIVVTKEVERKVVPADQVTMTSASTEQSKYPPMRTTWIERGSDDSLEHMLAIGQHRSQGSQHWLQREPRSVASEYSID